MQPSGPRRVAGFQRISDLHLVAGISDVSDVGAASVDARDIFLLWDEPGADKRRTRLVQAYECQEGEEPSAPLKSIRERDTWPTTVAEAARGIADGLDKEFREQVRRTAQTDLIQFHHGWGTGIRNHLGLRRGNEALLRSCGGGELVSPDDCSMKIIERVWEILRRRR